MRVALCHVAMTVLKENLVVEASVVKWYRPTQWTRGESVISFVCLLPFSDSL